MDFYHIFIIINKWYRKIEQFIYMTIYIIEQFIYTVGPKIRTRGGSQFWRESGFLGNFISEKCKSPDF